MTVAALIYLISEGTDLSDAGKPSSVAPNKKPNKKKLRCSKGFYYRASDPDHGGKPVCYTCTKRNGYSFVFVTKLILLH